MSQPYLGEYFSDYAMHFNALRVRGIEPDCTAEEAWQRRVQRELRARVSERLNTHERFQRGLHKTFIREIIRRGGDTFVTVSGRRLEVQLIDRDPVARLYLFATEREPRRPGLAYLCGRDDNGPWAVRVEPNITTVAAALEYITPPAVRAAQQKGVQVLRQGDVYVVPTEQDQTAKSASALPWSHRWDPARRVLTHAPRDRRNHQELAVPFPAVFIPQRALEMARAVRGHAD